MIVFQVGEWKVKPSVSQISSPTESRNLTPQHLLAIMAFINASEHTLSKDELLKEVWQGRIVSDDAITRLISDLRKQLKINGSALKYIKTLHGFGYKLDLKPIPVEENVTKKTHVNPLLFVTASVFIGILIIWYSLVFDVNHEEPQQRQLTDWPVTLQTHEINLNNEANYIATGLEHSLIYHNLNEVGSAVYQQINDKSELLFQLDGKIKNLISSPDGQFLAFIIEQPECSIQVYSLAEQTLHTLSNCRITPEYALDWQDNENLSYVQKSNQGMFQFYQLSRSQRPVIETLNLPLCLSVKKVFINQGSQRFISCKVERGDALFIEKSGEISTLLTYRTIMNFVVDTNDIIYMTHSPSWKSGITRFDYKQDKISFANIGWVWDIRLQNDKLIIVRDLKNTDLLTLNLDDLNQSALESSKIHSAAIAMDNGVLWQLDNRGGPFALYKNKKRLAWDNEIDVDLTKVVSMSVSESDHWLLLTRKIDNYFVHHWLDLNIDTQSTFASYRRFESANKTGTIENGEFLFKQRNNQMTSFNISSGQVKNIELSPLELNAIAKTENKECVSSPIETSSSKIKMFAMKQGTMFEEYQVDSSIKSRQWQDHRLLSTCGFNQIIFDRDNNRLLYTAETQKYRDISFINL